jgi:hypothetical protein
MNRVDWNLLVLAAAEGKPLDPAQLQKVLFLLQDKVPGALADGYHFRPYHYGPFDPDVYSDAEFLAQDGLVSIVAAGGGWKTYAATDRGLAKAKCLVDGADPSAVAYARRVVQWARGLSFNQLVGAIYREYPQMRVNSIFRE